MQKNSFRAGAETPHRLSNPFLDCAIAGLEAQLKAWQAYQVEGTRFVANRMRADLEQLRALGHCSDPKSIAECQLAWLREIQKDYAEEGARIAATAFTMDFTDLAGLGWLFGRRTAEGKVAAQTGAKSRGEPNAKKGLQAAA